MKRKVLASLLVIAVVAGLVGAGTFAYFKDTETSEGNTFTAGTLDLTVDDENPWTSTPVTFGPLEPGGENTLAPPITVKNIGTLSGDLYIRVTDLEVNP